MLAKKIPDVKSFMNQLLLGDTFHTLLLCEATVQTATTISVSGKLNLDFFETAERELLHDTNYATWELVRPTILQAIKGNRTPTAFKMVFMLPKRNMEALIMKHNLPMQPEDVAGLYFNIYYENETLRITSGTSLRVFTMDKQLEQIWDDSLMLFFKERHIYLED